MINKKTSPFGYSRGWLIIWDAEKKAWFYEDNGKPLDDMRPCKRCGKPPTKEGHDACLGTIPGVAFACCGHGTSINGISNRIMVYEKNKMEDICNKSKLGKQLW